MENNLFPNEVTLHKQSKTLELAYGEDHYHLSAEYLRVYSPSAEVRGHAAGQEVLQTNKEQVAINQIEATGNYALKIYFDDGHDSGLFTWDYLHQLATQYDAHWQDYLDRLEKAGYQRQSN
ncbi:MAG: 1-(5-phosphoribosyl)-5-((5-phosphoribosylamino)methylideneamino)imidazole-4-carboxamide isomerase [Gammaproteobacteria bacterium]|nr:MAG: 1-(5-phosphoribosyl)-5-((5-phosphoribosylamino)methylideneamino)imidazole-4-carboxamide isomerase [Gammaproteobacteria bacterium]